MSKTRKISVSTVREIQPGEQFFDIDLKGFGVRRQSKAITYFVHKRIKGRQRRITIGHHGAWTPDKARQRAAELLREISAGADPATTLRETKLRQTTFNETADEFMKLHGPKLKATTQATYGYLFKIQLRPAFGTRTLADITKADVARFHTKWARKPRTANHALALLSKLMSWAEDHGLRPDGTNPCLGIERFREIKRERFLSADELERLGEAMRIAENAMTENAFVLAAIRILLFTGARLSEILTLQWSFVDLDHRLLRLPDSKTGSKAILLNEPAVQVLKRLPRIKGNPYVLPGHVTGQHLVNIRDAWQRLCAEARIEDCRVHDIRHSFGTMAVDAGGSLPLIGRLLGHSQPQTTARYAHVRNDPAAALNEAAGNRLARALRFSADKDAERAVAKVRKRMPLASLRVRRAAAAQPHPRANRRFGSREREA